MSHNTNVQDKEYNKETNWLRLVVHFIYTADTFNLVVIFIALGITIAEFTKTGFNSVGVHFPILQIVALLVIAPPIIKHACKSGNTAIKFGTLLVGVILFFASNLQFLLYYTLISLEAYLVLNSLSMISIFIAIAFTNHSCFIKKLAKNKCDKCDIDKETKPFC